jgi:hypothetical protein
MATIQFFADYSEEPVLWVPPKIGAYTVEVGEGVRVVRTRSVKNALQGGLLYIPFVFVLFSVILMTLSTVLPEIVNEQSTSSASSDFCDYGYREALTGDETVYCVEEMMPLTMRFDKIETGDENHVRETYEGSQTNEYRWHEDRGVVVLGFLDDGWYDCVLFIPESSLPAQWSFSDLMVDDPESYHPSWCGEEASTAERNYTEGEDPFDGTWLFVVGEESPEVAIFRIKVVGLTSFYEEWMSPLWFSSEWGQDEGIGDLMGLVVALPILFLMWFIAGHRNQMVIFDADGKKLIRKRSGAIPTPFKRVWQGLDLGRVRFDHHVRTREHSSGGGEDGPRQTWTTTHPGVDMMVPTDSGDIVAIFFEYGSEPHLHNFLILELLENLGVPREAYLQPETETPPPEDAPEGSLVPDEGGPLSQEVVDQKTNSGAFWSFDGQNSEESP